MPGPPQTGSVAQAVAIALGFAGKVPYVWGGTTPAGFDCSGLVQYAYGKAGFKLPRTSEEQWNAGVSINRDQLAPGDLVFSSWGGEDPHGHVAIYTGGGKLVEAPHTGENVHVIPLDAGYLAHVTGYRRIGAAPSGGVASRFGQSQPTTGGADTGLISWPVDIVTFFSDATDVLTGQAAWMKAFFQPSTYVRIGSGLFGTLFLFAALFFLIRQTRS